MFGKVKKLLGIEGAKIELVIPEEVSAESQEIKGTILLQTINETSIDAIVVRLIEVYSRGRRSTKRTDEYELGRLILNDKITISKNQKAEVTFVLPFKIKSSPVDDFGNKNFLTSGLASLARLAKGTSSTYYVEAIATEEGTRLNPKARLEITIK